MLKNRRKEPIRTIQPLSNDPWSAANEGSEQIKDNWMMSYIDVLTLLLTLLVLLLATQKIKSEPIVAVAQSVQVAKIDVKKLTIQKPLGKAPQQKEIAKKSAPVHEDIAEDWITNQFVTILEDLYQNEIQKSPLSSQSETALINTAIEIAGLAFLSSADQNLIDPIALNKPTDPDLAVALEKISNNDPVEIVQEDRSVRIEFNDDLLFTSGEAELKTEGSTLLNKWVDLLQQQTGVIFVEGHTDDQLIATRRYPSNWELSASRASAVTRYFIERGIESDRLRAVGYADTRPRDNNNTSEARKRNRRVSIIIQTLT